MSTVEFDPFASTAEVPHEVFAEMRRSCPVARTPSGWYIARYADVFEATKHLDQFVSSFREPGIVVPDEEQFINEIHEPRHGKIRKIINTTVAHHRTMHVEGFVRDLCNEYLDPIIERGGGELIHEFVAPVPINVIAYLIGVPRGDWSQFREWSDELVEGTYPTKYRNERGIGMAGAHPEFAAYVDGLIADRKGDGDRPDDLVTRLMYTEVEGKCLTDLEVRTQLVFLIVSGNETTRHLIANLLARVSTDPELFAMLQADRSLVERAVEESLRLDPPVFTLLRNCEQSTEMFGPAMEPGEKVVFGVASANRDEAVHDDADSFRLDRTNFREHVAFGGGPHICPGASLARLEARVALETFLDRVASVAPTSDWTWRKTPVFWANGPVDLHVELTGTREFA
jgi:cytochrome P450